MPASSHIIVKLDPLVLRYLSLSRGGSFSVPNPVLLLVPFAFRLPQKRDMSFFSHSRVFRARCGSVSVKDLTPHMSDVRYSAPRRTAELFRPQAARDGMELPEPLVGPSAYPAPLLRELSGVCVSEEAAAVIGSPYSMTVAVRPSREVAA